LLKIKFTSIRPTTILALLMCTVSFFLRSTVQKTTIGKRPV